MIDAAYDLVFDTYSRELERYQFDGSMELVERQFCFDSEVVLNWVTRNPAVGAFNRIAEVVIQLQDACESLTGQTARIQRTLVSQFGDKEKAREYEKDYRNIRPIAVALRKSFPAGTSNFMSKEIISAFQASNQRYPTDLVFSLMHMHCNRMSLNTNEEQTALYSLMRIVKEETYEKNSTNY